MFETPIFICVRDRVSCLRGLVDWLLNAGYRNIILLDNDSSYPPLLSYLVEVERSVQVVRLGVNYGHKCLWESGALGTFRVRGPFVYSDPDVLPVESCPVDVIGRLWEVLLSNWGFINYRGFVIEKVGLGLKIDDLPVVYEHRDAVMGWEGVYWSRPVGQDLFDATTDTTFALYKPGTDYSHEALRTGGDFMVRHTPWYEDSSCRSEESMFYAERAKDGIVSWGGKGLPSQLVAEMGWAR